jgi:Arc/MetJ-type ribon-helix-helix transcriptional regulator
MSAEMVTIGVRLTAEENQRLTEVAEKTFRKKSDVIRFGLDLVFREEREKRKEAANEVGG